MQLETFMSEKGDHESERTRETHLRVGKERGDCHILYADATLLPLACSASSAADNLSLPAYKMPATLDLKHQGEETPRSGPTVGCQAVIDDGDNLSSLLSRDARH